MTGNAATILGNLSSCWHRSAPNAVRRAHARGDSTTGWRTWTKHLRCRQSPVPPAKVFKKHRVPWCPLSDTAVATAPDADLDGRVRRWLDETETCGDFRELAPSRQVEHAAETVLWARALPELAADLSPEVWWELLEYPRTFVVETGHAVERTERTDPLAWQLVGGELGLTLAYLFPELQPCRDLAKPAGATLSDGLIELTDGEGLLHARHIDRFRSLTACWIRSFHLGKELDGDSLNEQARIQFDWLAHNLLCMSRRDGSAAFSSTATSTAERKTAWRFARATAKSIGDATDRHLAQTLLPSRSRKGKDGSHDGRAADGRTGSKSKKKRDRNAPGRDRPIRLPKPSLHSEWAQTSILRSGWSAEDSRATVVFHEGEVRLELETVAGLLISGSWQLEVTRDGVPQAPTEWEEVCWVSDKDADYLELACEMDNGVCFQRQILLARQDRFLLLADAVLGPKPADWDYRASLSLATNVAWEPEVETHDGLLRCGRRTAASVLPLALPEWRDAVAEGSLRSTPGRGVDLLEHRLRVPGRQSLFAPLFFDLKPKRSSQPRTWRQLTVAENLVIQPPDVAVGYRAMTGRRQWLIYRSLAGVGNRTLLGHNLSTEYLVARFLRTGETEPLIEVE